MKTKTIGVLALQGDFEKHAKVCRQLGAQVIEVRKPEDLKQCKGLIIPGGESTVILRQIDFIKLREPLIEFGKTHPIFGTCAGLIVMAKTIKDESMKPLALLDVTVQRNAFGRQVDSFKANLAVQINGKEKILPTFFIRAPKIYSSGPLVEILAKWQDESVLVEQGNLIGATFHTETEEEPTLHRYFLAKIKER